MTEWALPPKKSYVFDKLLHKLEDEHRDDILQFMRGGFWRNFLVRYSEVNNQHKKMLRVHNAVYQAGASQEASGLLICGRHRPTTPTGMAFSVECTPPICAPPSTII